MRLNPGEGPAHILRLRRKMQAERDFDFIFTSPFDDHISRTVYFERCWPYCENVRAFHVEKLFEKGSEADIRYEREPKAGGKFRNTEFFRIEGNKIKEVEVYFGSLPEGMTETSHGEQHEAF